MWYTENLVQGEIYKGAKGYKKNPPIFQTKMNDWRLTTAEKRRILLNNIYGVDIDLQAVEVAKLNLLLTVLENESDETLQHSLGIAQERALPDLGNNIKCGNSLVGPDFYRQKNLSMLDDEEIYRVNVFDWGSEFSSIFRRGGFDAVIGNPPYLKEANNKEAFTILRKGAIARYCIGKMDLWYLFACQSIDLLRYGGLHSFIATNTWVTSEGARILRKKIMQEYKLQSFVDFSDFKIFTSASIQTMVYVLEKTSPPKNYKYDFVRIHQDSDDLSTIQRTLKSIGSEIEWDTATIAPNNAIAGFVPQKESVERCLDKMITSNIRQLSGSEIGSGIDVLQDSVTGRHLKTLGPEVADVGDGIFVLKDHEYRELGATSKEMAVIKPYYTARELNRYAVAMRNTLWIIYAGHDVRENIESYPNIKSHLSKFQEIMTSVYAPYGLHRTRDERLFNGEGIFCLRKTRRPKFSLVSSPCYVSRAFIVIKPDRWQEDLKYITGILNSELIWFWLYHRGKRQGDQLQVDVGPIRSVPIRVIDFNSQDEKSQHDRIVTLVQTIQDFHRSHAKAKTAHERQVLKRNINATDHEIDRHVYNLYNLTDSEIRIVEKAIK